MTDYISREAALEITTRTCGDYAAAFSEIRKLPAADVAEVVHGQWLDVYNDFTVAHCSNCGAAFDVADEGKGTAAGWARFKNRYKGCPGCRALMDGGCER